MAARVTKNFDYFRDARAFALRLSGARRLSRTEPRQWRGNGFGYSPASYAAVDEFGRAVCTVRSNGYCWQVTWQHEGGSAALLSDAEATVREGM